MTGTVGVSGRNVTLRGAGTISVSGGAAFKATGASTILHIDGLTLDATVSVDLVADCTVDGEGSEGGVSVPDLEVESLYARVVRHSGEGLGQEQRR